MHRTRGFGAAAVLVAVGALLTGCAGPAGSPVRFVEAAGRRIPYADTQPWTDASIASRTAREVTVFATGFDPADGQGGGPCGPPVLRLRAEETDRTVRIAIQAYQEDPDLASACSAVGYLPTPHTVTLQRALGNRTLLAAGTEKRPRLLVGSEVPDLPDPGLGASVLRAGNERGSALRTWQGEAVALEVRPPATVRENGPYGRLVQQPTIHGVDAAVYSTGGGPYGQQTVQWTPNAVQTLILRVSNRPSKRWTTAQAVALARAVTGYRVADTGRLPQPATPGTTVATYSSADGPVRHAENLWKSSGIWIGVACRGRGTVTVAMRGTSYPVRCGDALVHAVRRSVGAPDDPFFVDVSATAGVRWTVALARASLDGS